MRRKDYLGEVILDYMMCFGWTFGCVANIILYPTLLNIIISVLAIIMYWNTFIFKIGYGKDVTTNDNTKV